MSTVLTAPVHELSQAFSSFAEVAGSLERSYGQLQTEVAQLRRELDAANRDLDRERERLRRQQAMVEMSAVLAHEIRNPLGSMELFAGLLAESALDRDSRSWVEHLQAGLRTLAATVNNVLHLDRLPRAQMSPTDFGELLGWAQGFLQPLARQSRVQLEVVNRWQGMQGSADRHCLEQVVLNLALNAFRSMPGGGWLRLRGRRSGDGSAAELEVIDSGPGIAPENLQRVFEAGFSTRPGSPGLGLAVCREVVEQHGGTITVESRPGRGARFLVRLPLFHSANQARENAC